MGWIEPQGFALFSGRETPRGEVELVKQRLREAEQIARERE